jgi:hypothetical protein
LISPYLDTFHNLRATGFATNTRRQKAVTTGVQTEEYTD